MPTAAALLDVTQYVLISDGETPLLLQAHTDAVRIAFSAVQPVKSNVAFHLLGGDAEPLPIQPDNKVWALATTDKSSLTISDTDPVDVHVEDVHILPVNTFYHRLTGVTTTFAATVAPDDRTVTVASGVGFANGDILKITDVTGNVIEPSLPTLVSGGGTTTFVLDRPIDNGYAIGDKLEKVETNMAVDGSVTPVVFEVSGHPLRIWHIQRQIIAMTHSVAADDSKFGSIPALTNGVVFTGESTLFGIHVTYSNWKSNFDMKMDMFDVDYTDKAGGGDFGTNGRMSLKSGSGAIGRVGGSDGAIAQVIIQDNLTGLIKFEIKAQGHVETFEVP